MLVAEGPDSQAEQLARAGKCIANALDAHWTVVYVERTPRPTRCRVRDARSSLGHPYRAIERAYTRHANCVIVGAPKRRDWRALGWPSALTGLISVMAYDFFVPPR